MLPLLTSFFITAAMPPPSGPEASAWTGHNLGNERAEWAGDMAADAEPHSLGQRLESIGQRPSMPSQRLESLAGTTACRVCQWLPSPETLTGSTAWCDC